MRIGWLKIMIKRLRFALAQLGRKPGGNSSLELLLECKDLPVGSCKQLDQRTWRYGLEAKTNEISARARKMGSITAWRSFKLQQSWIWIQIIPFASPEDAQKAMPDSLRDSLRNLRAKVKLVSEDSVIFESNVNLSHPTFVEQKTVTAKGDEGSSKYVSATVGTFGFMIAASSLGTQNWDEVLEIAVLQSNKIKTLIARNNDIDS